MKYTFCIIFAMIAISLATTSCSKKTQQASEAGASNLQATGNSDTITVQDVTQPTSDDPNANVFKFTITTDNVNAEKDRNAEPSVDNPIQIAIFVDSVNNTYPVKYDLDCEGDGEFEHTGLAEYAKCTYEPNTGTHQIWLRGDIPAIRLCDGYHGTPNAIQSIDSWGNIQWKSMHSFAENCDNLVRIPNEAPNLSEVTDMSKMFYDAKNFNQPIEHWDVSKVTNMEWMFEGASSFNQPLENWDVSHVVNMHSMFHNASAFNQSLSSWNASSAKNITNMFSGARSFSYKNDPIYKLYDKEYTKIFAPKIAEINENGVIFKKKTLEWGEDVDIYHAIPVFPSDSDVNKIVNNILSKVQDDFFAKNAEALYEEVLEGRSYNNDDKYVYNVIPGVNQSKRVLSVTLMTYEDFGRVDVRFETFNFNKATGERVYLNDIYPMSDSEIKSMIANAVESKLIIEGYIDDNDNENDNENDDEEYIDWGKFYAMGVSDFNFFVKNDKVYIVFGKWDIAARYGNGQGEYELPRVKSMFKGEKFNK